MIELLAAALGPTVEASAALLAGAADWRQRRRQAALIEDVFLALLDREAERQGRAGRDLSSPQGPGRFDAVYPDGLFDLTGPLAVELKFWGSRPPAAQVAEMVAHYSEEAADKGLASLLFVSAVPGETTSGERMATTVAAQPIPVTVWEARDVQDLLNRYADELPEVLRDAALEPIRVALADGTDWRPTVSAYLDDLRDTYQAQGVVLVLGAGVSIGSGLPNWDDLVGALFVSMVTEQLNGEVDDEQAIAVAKAAQGLGGDSPLLSARYLRRGIEEGNAGDPVAFQRTLSKALYRSVDDEFTASPLLAELAKLCTPLRTGAKVHAAITYNFDDLLETELDKESVRHRTVFSGREHPIAEELPVYHAHGFVPRDIDRFDGLGEGILAFSEEGYHQLFRDPYHWTNVVQLQAFQQQTCLFIGLSMTDPNLRRLLEYAAQRDDEPRHYVFLKRHSAEDLIRESALDVHDNPGLKADTASDYLRVHHALQERVLRELGLKVLWVESYDDIPDALGTMRR